MQKIAEERLSNNDIKTCVLKSYLLCFRFQYSSSIRGKLKSHSYTAPVHPTNTPVGIALWNEIYDQKEKGKKKY